MGVQTIRTESGEELIVIPRREYIALLARAGDEAAEDEMTAVLVDEAKDAIARGEDVSLPLEIWDAMEAGENPIKVLREYRGLSQAELAAAAGVDPDLIAELEGGREGGAPDRLKEIARALGVPLNVLVE
jgi:ribosome-binding protein aMBF1 (putative translation factor)